MPWVCLQCVIVVFPDHTLLLFGINRVDSGLIRFLQNKKISTENTDLIYKLKCKAGDASAIG